MVRWAAVMRSVNMARMVQWRGLQAKLTSSEGVRAMRMTRIDWILLPFLVAVLAGIALGAFLLAGFIGLGVLGLIIGVMAQRIELEKDGAVSNEMTTSLYADQFKAREGITRAERAERHAESVALLK